MLRFTVLVLALANAGYYAWSHGLLPIGQSTSGEEAEPQRLSQQLHPEALRILPKTGSTAPPSTDETTRPTTTPPTAPTTAPPEPVPPPSPPPPAVPVLSTPEPVVTPPVAALAAPPPKQKPDTDKADHSKPETKPDAKTAVKPEPSTVCLQAGAFDTAQADVLRKALGSLPANSWNLNSATLPGRWMVYMGRFPDLDTLNKKRNELRERNVAYDRPRIQALEPGLSLGRYSTEEAAQRALAQLGTKGVRSARVVQERTETPAFVLRLPAIAADARQRITNTLRPALAGKTLRPCSND
ncbi:MULTISPECIES: SPOR domain-containing protein [Giesbergeria]|uniref:SPOR domain-containing protein n=1 Tax=Giesbergeria sinuosa TaxID=80883 RepID=A0ABV9QJD9_9BURK